MSTLQVIFGTGPVGCWTARALLDQGVPVRAVNRSGRRPELLPADVELVMADLAEPEKAIMATYGASVLYQALNPPYNRWAELFPPLQANALAAASTVGARYVSIENLYMYDSSGLIRENSPQIPRSGKGRVRKKMAEDVLAAHRRGEIQASALRSSDYYGPGVEESTLGERVFGSLAEGKKAQLTGNPDLPHSWAYIEDVGRAAAVLGTRGEALGQAWILPHARPATQVEMVGLVAEELGVEPQFSSMGTMMMRIGGLFVPEAREMVEMMYEFTEPFVADGGAFQKTFSFQPTPVEEGVRRTARWYAEQGG